MIVGADACSACTIASFSARVAVGVHGIDADDPPDGLGGVGADRP
jgi:hypothetical protein